MSKNFFIQYLVWPWVLIGLMVFLTLFFVSAPYGRHNRKGWGWQIDNRLGWIVMEIISPLVFAYFFLSGNQAKSLTMWIFASLWIGHYLNRSIIFPLRLQTNGKKMPLTIALMAVFFNSVNGFLNGYYLGNLSGVYANDWWFNPLTIIGLTLFITGFYINLQADEILLKLRKNTQQSTYQIPRGGLYQWISCPNYFGEIIEWTGFALMTMTWPAWTFAWWTIANLLPRAISNHQWYQNYFPDYPKNRKALIPYLL
jgi:3-oxo-5-alpha-steroid 4-dehydrogenase 1